MHIYTPHGIMEFLYPIHKQLDFHSIPMISGSRSGLSHSQACTASDSLGDSISSYETLVVLPKGSEATSAGVVGWPWWV